MFRPMYWRNSHMTKLFPKLVELTLREGCPAHKSSRHERQFTMHWTPAGSTLRANI